MYIAAKLQQERLVKARAAALLERSRKEDAEAVFTPRITAMAQGVRSRRAVVHGHGPVHEAKQKALAEEHRDRVMKECTFQQNVNRGRSASASVTPVPAGPRWGALYADSERRKLTHEIRQR